MISVTWKPRALGIFALALFITLGLLAKDIGAGQLAGAVSREEADGARLLKGAIDMHLHIDPDSDTRRFTVVEIWQLKQLRALGMRGVVLKDHRGPTGALAYLIRTEVPGLEAFGSVVLNREVGGVNVAAVENLATQIKEKSGRLVWMPTFDSEACSKGGPLCIKTYSNEPSVPFVVSVSRNGELLPEVKTVISVIAKYGLVLVTGHSSAEEDLMLVREGRKQGVQHMILTHAIEAPAYMNEAQMREATKLGAFIEFDFRKFMPPSQTTPEAAEMLERIRKIGPEFCILTEFWTNPRVREYGRLDVVGQFAAAMRAKGFTDRELDLMMKVNPARLLDLPLQQGTF